MATRGRYYDAVISVGGPWPQSRRPVVEVVAAVILTTLFAAALAVIFGVTALRDARLH